MKPRLLLLVLFVSLMQPLSSSTFAADGSPEASAHLTDFQVFEFRRYTVRPGEREHFAEYFEAYFPEAMEQTGAIVAGSFFERAHENGFTWIRGFHTFEARAVNNAQLYYGPVWKEHKNTMNGLMTDSDNVLLLRPLTPEDQVPVLATADPVRDRNQPRGVVVAEIFAAKPGQVENLAAKLKNTFDEYHAAGVRSAGLLVTLDVTNNFPQLPVRTDGPFLVWLGIVQDEETLNKKFTPLVERSLHDAEATGLVRSAPEYIILSPTPRSRLRWIN